MCNTPNVKDERLDSVPVMYTSGTYYEVGFNVGRTFRGLIEDFISDFPNLNEVLIPAYNTEQGRKAYDVTLLNLKENFPHYVRELQGTADGARVHFYKLMLLHMDLIVPKNSGINSSSSSSFGCTTVCSNYDEQVTLGHTEDALPETLNHLYVVSAHIKEVEPQGKWETREEKFTALCYAGHLPGFCMGFNAHGLAYSINVISPIRVLAGKTPRHFLTRAILGAKSKEEVEDILRDEGNGSADGFSVNMIFMKKKEKENMLYNIEVGPSENCTESPISVHPIGPGKFYVHTNKYLRLKIPEDIDMEKDSSSCRLSSAERHYPIDCKEAVLSVVSDVEDKDYPIFRDGTQVDTIKTTAIGLFDILDRKWIIWMKNPKTSNPIASLPMNFDWRQNSGKN